MTRSSSSSSSSSRPRRLAALLCTHLLLAACTAQAITPLSPSRMNWPEPQPQPEPPRIQPYPYPLPEARTLPDFQAPSATHCARPIETREIPGPLAQSAQAGADLPRRRTDLAGETRREATADRASKAAPPPAAPVVAAPSPSFAPADAAVAERAAPGAGATPQMLPMPPGRRPAPRPAVVTAGMVDDNADFAAFLAFQGRTQVEHRMRDVSERYLLQVRDNAGSPVHDAQVAVRAAQGATMWARTDTAGRVWLHPNAFDPGRAAFYEVAVRQGGREARAILQRGQKSAVDVTLSQAPLQAQARLDLVFLIDATGSMADEIGKLKASIASIASEVARLPSRPDLCFGLVAYRDRGDAFMVRTHDLTNSLSAFQGVLNNLRAAGGGDYPEAMNEALHEAVHSLAWRGDGATRMVVLLADAPPHLDYGGPQYDNDMAAALGKGIKVFSVGASGLDKQGEFIQRQIAQYTGGRFVFLTYADAADASSGPGRETTHDVGNYSVDTLDRLIVRLVRDELGRLPEGIGARSKELAPGGFLRAIMAGSGALAQSVRAMES